MCWYLGILVDWHNGAFVYLVYWHTCRLVYLCIGLMVYSYTEVLAFWYVVMACLSIGSVYLGILVYWYVGMVVSWYIGMVVSWYLEILVCWYLGILVYQYMGKVAYW